MKFAKTACVAGMAFGLFGTTVVHGQVVDPFYAGSYTVADLGSVPDLPANYGGLCVLPSDGNTLIIGGGANGSLGVLYSIGLTRGAGGHITGFTGELATYASAPYNDGGVTFGPDGVLFASRWPTNELAEYRPGSLPGAAEPDKIINLATFGVAQSHSAIAFVPSGFPGAGRMKLSSWSGGQFYDAAYAPDGTGTFDISSATQTATLTGGPEGFAYVPIGSPQFASPSMIVSEYSAGSIATYEVDGNGNPIEASRRPFISLLFGAEGAFIDPVTGDFLFSTFGSGNHVIVVSGFYVNSCDPDLNQDGNVDQDDVSYLINVIGGGENPTGIDPDFNHDGNADQDDIGALINSVGGGGCP